MIDHPAKQAAALFSSALGGYAAGISKAMTVLVLVLLIACTSIAIAFPLWFVSTTFPIAYTAVVLISIIGTALVVSGKRAFERGRLALLANFAGLLVEYGLIMFLFANRTIFLVPAFALSIEFIAFLVFTRSREPRILAPWMRTVLSLLALSGFPYFAAVLFREQQIALALPLSIVSVLAFGLMIHDKRKTTSNAPGPDRSY